MLQYSMWKIVLVTDVDGFLGARLVEHLLELGYTVRGTAREPDEARHLMALPGAGRLTLHKADPLESGAYDRLVDGVEGVFHVAYMRALFNTNDPKAPFQVQSIDTEVQATLNLLQAVANVNTVNRVIHTSSTVALELNRRSTTPNTVIDESWWSDPVMCSERGFWQAAASALAEKAALDFVKDKRFDLVVMNPASFSVGKLLGRTLSGSAIKLVREYLLGSGEEIPNCVISVVDVQDVCEAHVLAYENRSAEGHYILVERVMHMGDIADKLRNLYPQILYPDFPGTPKPPYGPSHEASTYTLSNKKARGLGMTELGMNSFRPIDSALRECVTSLQEKGLV